MILAGRLRWRRKTIADPGMRLRHIEGHHNALVKELRRAFAQGELTPDGHCAIEGVRILEEASAAG